MLIDDLLNKAVSSGTGKVSSGANADTAKSPRMNAHQELVPVFLSVDKDRDRNIQGPPGPEDADRMNANIAAKKPAKKPSWLSRIFGRNKEGSVEKDFSPFSREQLEQLKEDDKRAGKKNYPQDPDTVGLPESGAAALAGDLHPQVKIAQGRREQKPIEDALLKIMKGHTPAKEASIDKGVMDIPDEVARRIGSGVRKIPQQARGQARGIADAHQFGWQRGQDPEEYSHLPPPGESGHGVLRDTAERWGHARSKMRGKGMPWEQSIQNSLLKIMKEHTPEQEGRDVARQRHINARMAPGEHGQEPFDVERYEKTHEEGGITHPRNVFKYLNHLADERYKLEPFQTRKDATPFDRLPYTSAPGLKDTLAKHGWDYKQTGHEPGHGVQQDNEDHLQDNIERLGKTHGDVTGVMQDLPSRELFNALSKPMSAKKQAEGRPDNPNFYNSIEKSLLKLMKGDKQRFNAMAKDKVKEVKEGEEPCILVPDGDSKISPTKDSFENTLLKIMKYGSFENDLGNPLRRGMLDKKPEKDASGMSEQDRHDKEGDPNWEEFGTPNMPEYRDRSSYGWNQPNITSGLSRILPLEPSRRKRGVGPYEWSIQNSLLKIMKYGSDINPRDVGMTRKNAMQDMDKAQGMQGYPRMPQAPAPREEGVADRLAGEMAAAGDEGAQQAKATATGFADAAGQIGGMFAGGQRGRWQYESGDVPAQQGGGATQQQEEAPVTPPSGPAGGDTTQPQQTKISVPDPFEIPDVTQNNQPNKVKVPQT